MTTAEKTNKLVMTALMMCMIIVLTMFVKVPIPLTQGYVHLGDAIMAMIMGLILDRDGEHISVIRQIIAMAAGGVFMVAGYFAAEGIMYGNWAAAALGIPWNIGQFVVGMIIAVALSAALCRTSAGKLFTYRLAGKKNA